ncbi:hypothetical protein [Flavobacterium ichthyis]|nr:hypothetical protein [Flavobacterium ichthyis]
MYKYIPYFYLLAAILFAVDGFTNLNSQERTPWLSFFFAALALFMFFFRRSYAKKFDQHKKKQSF